MAFTRGLYILNKIIKSHYGELILSRKDVANGMVMKYKIALPIIQTRYCSNQKDQNIKLLSELTGCDNHRINAAIEKMPYLAKMEHYRIRKVYNVLKKFGFKTEDFQECIEIFRTHHFTLKNHYMVLEEGGINVDKITLTFLRKYVVQQRRKIKILKAEGVMMKNVNPLQSYLSYLQIPLSSCPDILTNDNTLKDAQDIAMRMFLNHKLGMTLQQIEGNLKTYSRLRHKSFRVMSEMVDMLINELGFTKEKINSHAYLIHSDPDNVREVLRDVKSLGGMDPVKVFPSQPKILSYSVENILRINNILKEFNLPEECAAKAWDIYTLGPESVRERLVLLKSVPQFAVLHDHPAILKLVLYQKKAQDRLVMLEKLKMKCASLHLLSSHSALFKKYAQEGEDRTRGDDIVFFLSKELSTDKIRAKLNRHPYWYHVSILSIRDTLQYLYSKSFTAEEILNDAQILLYSKSVVDQEFSKLESQPDLQSCRTPEGKLRRDTILPLILYFIELPHNFSGGGIWTSQSTS